MGIEKTVSYQQHSIFYRVYGSGQTVMLVHGFGETGDVWKNQVEHLTGFRLIVPDLPGSGRSEMIDDMSMEGMAEVLKAILDAEQTGKDQIAESSTAPSVIAARSEAKGKQAGGFRGPSLIGHSMGGYVGLAFAEKYDSLLSSFGLFHSSAYPDTEEKKATRRKGIEFMQTHGGFEFLKTAVPNLFSPKTKEERPELIDEFLKSLSGFSSGALIAYYHSMMGRPDRTAILKKARIPILFIMGEFDNAVPLKDSLAQSHLPERVYISILHESGHMGMLEEKDKSNHVLEEFLKGLS